MNTMDVLSSKNSKFFPKGGVCRTVREGKVSTTNGVISVPVDSKITIEYFNAYTNRVLITIDGRIRGEATYEYLMDCVVPITVDTGKNIDAVHLMQRTHTVFDNEALVKSITVLVLVALGFLIGKVF